MLSIWQLWLIGAIALLIVELLSAGFYVICFSIGALATALVAAFSDSFTLQLAVFSAVSLLCVFLVRPIIVRHFDLKGKDQRKSNTDVLVGKIGFISQTVTGGGYGRVAIDGDDWKCVSKDGIEIEKGARVRVVSLDSIILTVETI